jgi:hypothetical protein
MTPTISAFDVESSTVTDTHQKSFERYGTPEFRAALLEHFTKARNAALVAHEQRMTTDFD